MRTRLVAPALLMPLLLSACVTSTTTTRTWSQPRAGSWARNGHVEWIRETVYRNDGNPAGGAVAGAALGGFLGSVLGARSDHGYFRPSAAGAVVGAATGAVVGAATSRGATEERCYEVTVRFDDGGVETFAYGGWPPFRVGDPVQLTPYGLSPV